MIKIRLKHNLLLLILGLNAAACLVLPPRAATAGHAAVNAGGHASGRPSARPAEKRSSITVTVRNPRCPACLKSLKTYLLAQNGVRAVAIQELNRPKAPVKVRIQLRSARYRSAVIAKIKAHDMEIMNLQHD